MLTDIKGPHLDYFRGGGNSLSHGSASTYQFSKVFLLRFVIPI